MADDTRGVAGRVAKIRAAQTEQLALLSTLTAGLDGTREAKATPGAPLEQV